MPKHTRLHVRPIPNAKLTEAERLFQAVANDTNILPCRRCNEITHIGDLMTETLWCSDCVKIFKEEYEEMFYNFKWRG